LSPKNDIPGRRPSSNLHNPAGNHLARYDASGITREHWKIMFISGMGFFTDAYDLFIIGVAMRLIRDEWHPPTVAIGLVTSTALLASAIGALLFGRVADMLGRKRIYGYEVLVLAIGAIASAFSPVVDRLPHHPRPRHRR
jgi:MFS transporter, PHS family, inorganic phosphate transporter